VVDLALENLDLYKEVFVVDFSDLDEELGDDF